MKFLDKLKITHKTRSGALDLLKYIGPGLLVTVGFIDPGNWATNLAAGSSFGYSLLWVVTFSSIMLIIIQHNVAHLGIVTGLCLARSHQQIYTKTSGTPHSGKCHACQHFYFSGRDTRRSYSPGYAFQYSG